MKFWNFYQFKMSKNLNVLDETEKTTMSQLLCSASKNLISSLFFFRDSIWMLDRMLNDPEKGGTRAEQVKKKIVEKNPTEPERPPLCAVIPKISSESPSSMIAPRRRCRKTRRWFHMVGHRLLSEDVCGTRTSRARPQAAQREMDLNAEYLLHSADAELQR